MADSPLSTPKRKHAQLLDEHVPNLNTTTQFTFDLRSPVKDGSASPRTNVAHRFRGLALDGGGGVSSDVARLGSLSPESKPIRYMFLAMHDEARDGARKRVKLPDTELPDANSPDLHLPATIRDGGAAHATKRTDQQQADPSNTNPRLRSHSPRQQSPRSVKFALDDAVVGQSETVANTGRGVAAADRTIETSSSPAGRRSSPPDGNKPRSRVRAGTPPLAYKTSPSPNRIAAATAASPDDPFITDPLRASLTWHDDEITIYDPDDSDDDGTGINGIGFKPTPAIAYARTIKRKQQLAEYRKREEREARAKRSQRRRGSPIPGLVELKGSVERRRVRFMESATELISF